MQVWLRLLIVWLLAAALPMQGMASVTMAACGPGHDRMAASHHRHAGRDAGATDPHRHAAHGTHSAQSVQIARDAHGDAHAGHTTRAAERQTGKLADAGHKCSSCASCCAGCALPSAAPQLPPSAAAPVVFTEAMVTIDAFASDGPDRPPRARPAV